jgi:hypothetical protein
MLAGLLTASVSTRPAHAEPPRFLIEVEQNQITVGEAFQVQVTLSASNEEIGDYRPPDFKGLRVMYAAQVPNQSTQMQIGAAGMIMQVSYSWRYQVAATRVGTVSIGPARIRISGHDFKSSIATLSVRAAGAANPSAPPPMPSSQSSANAAAAPAGGDAPDRTGPEAGEGSFIRMVADKTRVFVGEAISATWFLYMNQPHDKYDTVVEPRMEGFWSEDVTTPLRRGSLMLTQEVLGGRPYQVGAILKKALFPLKPGHLTVTSMEANLSRVDFFGGATAEQHVRSPPTVIEVSPLPAAGQPVGFDTGNVGRFSLSAHVDRNDVAVGDAVTLTVEISGRGNLKKVGLPSLPKVPGWKVYEPRVTTVIDPATGVTGNKSAEILLLPERGGTVQIPSLVLTFFDPDTRQYERAEAPGFTLKATGDAAAGSGIGAAADAASRGANGGAPTVPDGVGTENVLSGDIRPLRTRAGLHNDVGATFLHQPGFVVLVVLPPLLLALALLGLRFRDRISADTEGRRQRLNRRRVMAHLSAAEAHRRQHHVGPFFAEIERVIRESIAAQLGRPVTGMQSAELREQLHARGLPAHEVEDVIGALEECDRARFAPGTVAEPETTMSAAVTRASGLIARLARVPREGKPT